MDIYLFSISIESTLCAPSFDRHTLTLVLCEIASWPSFAGRPTSHTPNSFLVIGVASRFQSSWIDRGLVRLHTLSTNRTPLTKVTNEARLFGIGCPLSIGDVSILVHHETKSLVALHIMNGDGTMESDGADLAELVQSALERVQFLDPALSSSVSAPQSVLERREPRIELNHP